MKRPVTFRAEWKEGGRQKPIVVGREKKYVDFCLGNPRVHSAMGSSNRTNYVHPKIEAHPWIIVTLQIVVWCHIIIWFIIIIWRWITGECFRCSEILRVSTIVTINTG